MDIWMQVLKVHVNEYKQIKKIKLFPWSSSNFIHSTFKIFASKLTAIVFEIYNYGINNS